MQLSSSSSSRGRDRPPHLRRSSEETRPEDPGGLPRQSPASPSLFSRLQPATGAPPATAAAPFGALRSQVYVPPHARGAHGPVVPPDESQDEVPPDDEDLAQTDDAPGSQQDAPSEGSGDESQLEREHLALVVRDYTKALEVQGLTPDGAPDLDADGDDSEAIDAFTIQQRVEEIRYLILPTNWIEVVASPGYVSYRVIPAHAAAVSFIATKVEGLLSHALAFSKRARRIEAPSSDWIVEAFAPLDEAYPTQLYVAKVFKFARSWLHYAATLLEYLLYMRDLRDLPSEPPEPFNQSLATYAASATPKGNAVRSAPSSGRTARPASNPPSQARSPSVPSARSSVASPVISLTARAARVPLPATPSTPSSPSHKEMSPRSTNILNRLRQPSPPEIDWYTQAPKTDARVGNRKNRRVTMDVPPSPLFPVHGDLNAFHVRTEQRHSGTGSLQRFRRAEPSTFSPRMTSSRAVSELLPAARSTPHSPSPLRRVLQPPSAPRSRVDPNVTRAAVEDWTMHMRDAMRGRSNAARTVHLTGDQTFATAGARFLGQGTSTPRVQQESQAYAAGHNYPATDARLPVDNSRWDGPGWGRPTPARAPPRRASGYTPTPFTPRNGGQGQSGGGGNGPPDGEDYPYGAGFPPGPLPPGWGPPPIPPDIPGAGGDPPDPPDPPYGGGGAPGPPGPPVPPFPIPPAHIDNKYRQSSVPEWDGNKSTVLDYFDALTRAAEAVIRGHSN